MATTSTTIETIEATEGVKAAMHYLHGKKRRKVGGYYRLAVSRASCGGMKYKLIWTLVFMMPERPAYISREEFVAIDRRNKDVVLFQ